MCGRRPLTMCGVMNVTRIVDETEQERGTGRDVVAVDIIAK